MSTTYRFDINLKQLRVFHHVAAHLSFTKAAGDLFITQPAVTKAIDGLEENLGARLFVRERNHLGMTEAGRVLQGYADRMMRLAYEAEQAVSALRINPHGVLRLGTTQALARYLMPPYLLRFYEAAPHVRIQMVEGTSQDMAQSVLDGHCDVAVVGRVTYDPGVETFPFPDLPADPLMVVVPPDHRLADRERVFFDDIRDEPLLLREQGSGVRRKVLELFRLRALQPNIFLEAANIDFTKELIRKGAGIGLLGRMSVSRDLARGNLRAIPLESDELAIQIDVVLPKEGYRPLVTRTFVECLRHTPACGK